MHQAASIGGGSYCLLNIIKVIDREKFEPVVALLSEGPLADEIRNLGVEVVIFQRMAAIPYNRSLLQRGSLKAYWDIRKSIPALKNLLTEKHIDVLYLNNMMLCRYLQPAKECGCKTVVHVREHWPLNEHKQQLEWARQCIYNFADKMIAINNYSARMFPKKEATIIYDWIDMEGRYKPIPMSDIIGEDCSSKKVLLFTGGQSYIKGTDYILEAFSKYVKGDEYRLLLLGGDSVISFKGWRALVKKLLEMAGRVGFSKRVEDLIKSDYRIKSVPAIFELSHIIEQSYCFVSYFRVPHANLGLAENIILGNPCVAAKTEESLEYTNNGEYALLVEPNNIGEFGIQLQGFLRDIERWKDAAEVGSKHLSEMFMPAKNIRILNKVLDTFLVAYA